MPPTASSEADTSPPHDPRRPRRAHFGRRASPAGHRRQEIQGQRQHSAPRHPAGGTLAGAALRPGGAWARAAPPRPGWSWGKHRGVRCIGPRAALRPRGSRMSAGRRLASTPEPMHRWQGAGGVTLAGDSWGDPDGPAGAAPARGRPDPPRLEGRRVDPRRGRLPRRRLRRPGPRRLRLGARRVYGQDVMVEDLELPRRGARRQAARAGRRVDGRRHEPGRRGRGPRRRHRPRARRHRAPDRARRGEEDPGLHGPEARGLRVARRGGRRHRRLPAPPPAAPQPRRPGQERPAGRRRALPLALGPEVPGSGTAT